MLRISKDQFDRFQIQNLDCFISRVVAFLQSQFDEYSSVSAIKIKAATEPLVVRSIAYGLETEQEIVVFVLAAHHLGNNFDVEIAEVNKSLSDPQKNSVWKMAWLEALIFQAEGRRRE